MSSDRALEREMPTPPRPAVQLKGRGKGLRLSISPRVDPTAAEDSLRAQLAGRSPAFFGDARVLIDFGSGRLDLALAGRLASVLDEAGLRLVGVTCTEASEGLPQERPTERAGSERGGDGDGAGALVVEGHLRGGQRVSHAGSVVVLGDVNPGAEIVAGEHVLVWGRLRGLVEAGLARDADAVDDIRVAALDLSPTQLRIGDAIARAPEEPGRVPTPETARCQEGRIVVDGWR